MLILKRSLRKKLLRQYKDMVYKAAISTSTEKTFYYRGAAESIRRVAWHVLKYKIPKVISDGVDLTKEI